MIATSLADAQSWLEQDRDLLFETRGFRTIVDREDVRIDARLMPDDANLLFRWTLPTLKAPADVVFDGFVNKILENHRAWTKEYTGGYVVDTPAPETRILYQTFDPGLPGVSKRDVCSVEVVRSLSGGRQLASFRSIDAVPTRAGFVRIDWWGAVICSPLDSTTSEMIYLDRENQGGHFPTWLMNRMMPRFLIYQAEHVASFFASDGPRAPVQ